MSVLGPLFVPRKDVPKAPKTNDPELAKYLDELARRIQTNELAIQRWANSAPRLAAVINECSWSATMNSNQPDFFAVLPIDGSVETFFSGIVDASGNKIIIPQNGWYLISATILLDTSGNPGDKTGNFETQLYKNGADPSGVTLPLTSSGTADLLQVAAAATYPGFSVGPDFQTVQYASTFAAKDYLQFFGENFVFLVATVPPGVVNPNTQYRARIEACSILFLGSTPTKVQ